MSSTKYNTSTWLASEANHMTSREIEYLLWQTLVLYNPSLEPSHSEYKCNFWITKCVQYTELKMTLFYMSVNYNVHMYWSTADDVLGICSPDLKMWGAFGSLHLQKSLEAKLSLKVENLHGSVCSLWVLLPHQNHVFLFRRDKAKITYLPSWGVNFDINRWSCFRKNKWWLIL